MYSSQRASLSHELPQKITMAGLIGAGKTTLANKLGEHLGAKVHHEAVDTNDLLPLFYADMKRWGFALQVALLTQRHAQLQRINWDPFKIHIEDRFMDEDHVFATTLLQQGNMTDIEFRIYEEIVETYENHARHPDLVVFLDVSVDKSLERIRERGREMEQGIPREYLETLHAEYQKFIRHVSKRIPVIRITWEEFRETEDVAELIVDRWRNKCFNVTE
jgi:deoxyadenosine/deoxycytidine kinase